MTIKLTKVMVPRMTRGLPVPVSNILDEFCWRRIEFLDGIETFLKALEGDRNGLNMNKVLFGNGSGTGDPSSSVTKEAATMEIS